MPVKKGKPNTAKAKMGKLIVFEGTDGSGKTTQSKLLINYLKKREIPVKYISFPRYDDSLWGAMVRRFLNGILENWKKSTLILLRVCMPEIGHRRRT